jgi:hypothetical protein
MGEQKKKQKILRGTHVRMIVRAFRDEIVSKTKKNKIERTYEYSYVRSGMKKKVKQKKNSRTHVRILVRAFRNRNKRKKKAAAAVAAAGAGGWW